MTEADIEAELKKQIKKLKGLCLKLKCPGFNGAPDRLILLPWKRIFFVETKRPKGGVLSAIQLFVHKLFAGLGFPVTVIFTPEQLKDFIEFIKISS